MGCTDSRDDEKTKDEEEKPQLSKVNSKAILAFTFGTKLEEVNTHPYNLPETEDHELMLSLAECWKRLQQVWVPQRVNERAILIDDEDTANAIQPESDKSFQEKEEKTANSPLQLGLIGLLKKAK